MISATTMTLDWKVCSRARLSRDPRFDGKFFIGVRGSGVYCRSICPAPTAKEKNCRYFPSAAAAAEAGYRPCLRCRPEASPGTPAWSGTSTTVSRALRLIAESGLDEGGVEALAARLGVGSRHLRRLFLQHLGATPRAVAHTRRLHFAKKLIDETQLSMLQVALASGFGCVRRFNAAVRTFYRRTPTHIRRLAHPASDRAANEYCFQLRFRPPYHWAGMLQFLGERAIPGVEVVDAEGYRRSIAMGGSMGYLAVSRAQVANTLTVRIQFDDPRALFLIIEQVRGMFDLNADWEDIAKTLRSDPAVAACVRKHPGLRVPGCWDGFELATQAILEESQSVAKAQVVMGRIAATFGTPWTGAEGLTRVFPRPEILLGADLTQAGVGAQQGRIIQNLAGAICDRQICFQEHMDSNAATARLVQQVGMAKPAAEYVAMRAMREPDAFPPGDSGRMSALGIKTADELEKRAEAWRPWRAYGAMYLWNAEARELKPGKKAKGAEKKRPLVRQRRKGLRRAASMPLHVGEVRRGKRKQS